MKPASLIVFAILALTFIAENAMAESTFDGTWSVTLNAHEYKNPDGSVARGVILHFQAKVENGVLHGDWRSTRTPASLEINGKIGTDGAAILNLKGIVGDEAYTPLHPHANKPYQYQVIAHFDQRHGTGRSDGSPRVNIFTFVKD
jgi:hypothetical protein